MGELPASSEVLSDPCCKCGCHCAKIMEKEEKMKEVIMEKIMEKISLDENMKDMAKEKSSQDLNLLMTKLQKLHNSLISEQTRVRLLLLSKDNTIRSLKEENKRLMLKINRPMEKSDSNASSKSSTDVETSDKTIDTNSLDSLSEHIPNIENKNVDEYGRRQAEDSQTIVEIRDPGQFVPSANINTSKEFNNNNLTEYVLVTDNVSKTGLVVLDSEDNDEADKISSLNNNLNIITTDRTAILPQQRSALRQMTNHRSAVKPSDIKHRDKVKTVTKEHKTLLSYWSDSFL